MLIRRKSRCGVFAGNSVWSTSERLVVELYWRYALYKSASFTFLPTCQSQQQLSPTVLVLLILTRLTVFSLENTCLAVAITSVCMSLWIISGSHIGLFIVIHVVGIIYNDTDTSDRRHCGPKTFQHWCQSAHWTFWHHRKNLRVRDTLALVQRCLRDTLAPVPKCLGHFGTGASAKLDISAPVILFTQKCLANNSGACIRSFFALK